MYECVRVRVMGDFRVSVALRVYPALALALALLCACAVCPARATGPGKCPVYPTLPNFDIRKMAGKWFEIERSFYLMEIATSCTELDVAVSERGHMLIVVNTLNRWTGSPWMSHGLGIPAHNGSSVFRYKLNSRVPYAIGRLLPGAGHYSVLFTDYDQFAIIWSCASVSIAHSDRIWVLARSREMSAALRAQVYTIMEELRLDPDRLILAKNHNCPQHY